MNAGILCCVSNVATLHVSYCARYNKVHVLLQTSYSPSCLQNTLLYVIINHILDNVLNEARHWSYPKTVQIISQFSAPFIYEHF
jgi:hypothetical protein